MKTAQEDDDMSMRPPILRHKDHRAPSVFTPDALLIVDIALIASQRRRGIGASLVNGVLVEARAAGLPVRLSVFASNAAALRFYLRLGFKPIESSAIGMRLEWRDPRHPEAKA